MFNPNKKSEEKKPIIPDKNVNEGERQEKDPKKEEEYLNFLEELVAKRELLRQRGYLDNLQSGEKKLETQTHSLFGSLRKKFKKGFTPIALLLLMNGFASKALAQDFENKNPEFAPPKVEEKYKPFVTPFQENIDLPNNIDGSFHFYRDDYLNEIRKIKSIGYEIAPNSEIMVLDTNLWDSKQMISNVEDAINAALTGLDFPLPQYKAEDLSRKISKDWCSQTQPGFMG